MRTKLKEGETLFLEVRKHWIVLVAPVFIFLSALVFYIGLPPAPPTLSGLGKLINRVLLLTLFFGIGYFFYAFLDRKYNIWAVTDRRVIDESGIITHKAKESPIEKINNVDVVQTIVGRMLGYGKVMIQTAATYGESWINFVEKPKELQSAILRQLEKGQSSRENTSEARETKETKECPFCAETILEKAKICRFCGRELPVTED